MARFTPCMGMKLRMDWPGNVFDGHVATLGMYAQGVWSFWFEEPTPLGMGRVRNSQQMPLEYFKPAHPVPQIYCRLTYTRSDLPGRILEDALFAPHPNQAARLFLATLQNRLGANLTNITVNILTTSRYDWRPHEQDLVHVRSPL